MFRPALRIVLIVLSGLILSQFASAAELQTAKVYRDYPGYVEPPTCLNPRLSPAPPARPAQAEPPTVSPAAASRAADDTTTGRFSRVLAGGHLYGGGWLGVTTLQSDDLDNAAYTFELDYANGYGGALLLGYDFGAWRIEAEGGYRTVDIEKISMNGVEAAESGDFEIKTMMFNGYYDFATGGDFAPYLGAGIGWAQLSYNDVEAGNLAVVDDSELVLAGQLAAGMLVALNETTMLDVGYRYLATEKPDFASPLRRLETAVSSHTVIVGLQFNF